MIRPQSLLEKLLVCPVTHKPLKRIEIDQQVFLSAGGYIYPINNDIPNMVPTPPPVNLQKQWIVWKKLQENAIFPYEFAPELNLAAKENEVVSKFAAFLNIKKGELLLDVGCGPQKRMPAYIDQAYAGTYIGIDPLPGLQRRGFHFVQGIGEALPFDDNSFDHVIFHSSLDHMLDFRIAMREAFRVLKKNGKISICSDQISCMNGSFGNTLTDWLSILQKGVKQFYNGIVYIGFSATIRYLIFVLKLKIPEGATDFFHMYFPHQQEIYNGLDALGFNSIVTNEFKNQVFLSAKKY